MTESTCAPRPADIILTWLGYTLAALLLPFGVLLQLTAILVAIGYVVYWLSAIAYVVWTVGAAIVSLFT